MYKIHLLPAEFGDSILVEYGSAKEPHYILIDGGPYYVFDEFYQAIRQVAPKMKEIELLVVTHIDIDHIDGIVKMLNQSNLPFNVKEIWFNGRKQLEAAAEILERKNDDLGSLQGEYLTKLIEDHEYPHNTPFKSRIACVQDYKKLPEIELDGGMKIKLLAPGLSNLADLIPVWDEELKGKDVDKKWEEETRYSDELGDALGIEDMQEQEFKGDKSEANCSSIAFIGTYKGKSCLFTGDSPSHVLLASIDVILDKTGEERLPIDAWKLAHHGSKGSTQDSIMSKIECKTMLISSNGKRYKHPDAPTIAKLLKHNGPELKLYFNYYTDFNKMWDKDNIKLEYEYETYYPKDKESHGITIDLNNA